MQHASATANPTKLTGKPKIAIIRSTYYPDLVDKLEQSAMTTLVQGGIVENDIRIIKVPGAFEIPLACKQVSSATDGIIALGVIVQGKTHHAGEIARACTDGLMKVQLDTNTPIAHEVLFVDSLELAKERSTKGKEAAEALLRVMAMSKNA